MRKNKWDIKSKDSNRSFVKGENNILLSHQITDLNQFGFAWRLVVCPVHPRDSLLSSSHLTVAIRSGPNMNRAGIKTEDRDTGLSVIRDEREKITLRDRKWTIPGVFPLAHRCLCASYQPFYGRRPASVSGCRWKASLCVKRVCMCEFTSFCLPIAVFFSVSVFVLHSSTLSLLLPGSHNCSGKLYDSLRLPGKHTPCLFVIFLILVL